MRGLFNINDLSEVLAMVIVILVIFESISLGILIGVLL